MEEAQKIKPYPASKKEISKMVAIDYKDIKYYLSNLKENTEYEMAIGNVPEEALYSDNEEQSNLGKLIQSIPEGSIINLNLELPPKCLKLNNCFLNNTKLKSIKILNKQLKILESSQMFKNCTELESVKFPNIKSINNTSGMFEGCIKLKAIDLINFEYINDASNMFKNCISLEEVAFKKLKKVNDASSMLEDCKELRAVKFQFDEINNMNNMFRGCENLETIMWGTTMPKSFFGIFEGCPNKKIFYINDDYETYEWINKNQDILSLSNYKINILPPRKISYYELKRYINIYRPNETYDMVIEDAPSNALCIDKNFNSKLNSIINEAADGTMFNIDLIVPNSDNIYKYCFYNNKHIKNLNLIGNIDIKDVHKMYKRCNNLQKIALNNKDIKLNK